MTVELTDRNAPTQLLLPTVAGLVGGGLTALGQGYLPDAVGSVANSAGSWSFIAFLVACAATNLIFALISSFITIVGLLVGYVALDELRGAPSSSHMVVLWLTAAVIVGPALGVAAHWVRRGRPILAAVGAGLLPGLLIGEGVYGLTVIASTTSATYWVIELVVGVVILSGACWWRLRTWGNLAIALAVTTGVALAFIEVY